MAKTTLTDSIYVPQYRAESQADDSITQSNESSIIEQEIYAMHPRQTPTVTGNFLARAKYVRSKEWLTGPNNIKKTGHKKKGRRSPAAKVNSLQTVITDKQAEPYAQPIPEESEPVLSLTSADKHSVIEHSKQSSHSQ